MSGLRGWTLWLGAGLGVLALVACSSDGDDCTCPTPTTGSCGGSGGTGAMGGSGGAGAIGGSQTCDQYIECVATTTPASLADAIDAYGAQGACWPELGEARCDGACADGLAALFAIYPGEQACRTGGTGGTGGGGGGGGTGGGTGGCNTTPMAPVSEDAGVMMSTFLYVAQSTLSQPVDVLNFELWAGTPGVETLAITAHDYASCMNCVVFYRGCDGTLSNCQQAFLAQDGEIEVTSSGGSGSGFEGTLRDADFIEVTIDNGQSTPVPGGEHFCWAPYDFSAPIQ